jgi:hypothetical protein
VLHARQSSSSNAQFSSSSSGSSSSSSANSGSSSSGSSGTSTVSESHSHREVATEFMTLWDALNTSSDDRYIQYTVYTTQYIHTVPACIHSVCVCVYASYVSCQYAAADCRCSMHFAAHSVVVCERYSMQLLQHTLEQTGCSAALR